MSLEIMSPKLALYDAIWKNFTCHTGQFCRKNKSENHFVFVIEMQKAVVTLDVGSGEKKKKVEEYFKLLDDA